MIAIIISALFAYVLGYSMGFLTAIYHRSGPYHETDYEQGLRHGRELAEQEAMLERRFQ